MNSGVDTNNKKVKIKGDLRYIPLKITHTGSGSFWVNLHALGIAKYRISVGAVLHDSSGNKLKEGRAELPKVIYPGLISDVTMLIKSTVLKASDISDLGIKF